MGIKNIFHNISPESPTELAETILETPDMKLERIISYGQTTPPGEWYDQDRDEWVLLLTGKAVLLWKESGERTTMNPGDYVHIPSHRQHRVEWTDDAVPTVWLTVHFPAE